MGKKIAKKKTGKKKKAAKKKPTKKRKKKAPKLSVRVQRSRFWAGKLNHTKSGLKKADLCKNKSGKIVSKKAQAAGRKKLGKWIAATTRARKELELKGFVACKKGSAYYKLAKKYYG